MDSLADVLNEPEPMTLDRMVALLEEQSSLFARLELLASKQRALVAQEDTSALLSVLGERQKLSNRLTRIAADLEPVRREWPVVRSRLSVSQRAAAERHLSESRQSLHRIMESDERDARVLAARKQTVACALRGAHETGRAVTAYRVPAGRSTEAGRLDEAFG